MFEDLKELVEQIDTLEAEVWRRNQATVDPKLKDWCRSQANTLSRMQDELNSYIRTVETAGDHLR
jgi:hypothetical protein